MSEEEETRPRRKKHRRNPLDIDYSLRIGTSNYHVLGKRRGQRRGEFDYYVMDDTLIRSDPKGHSRRPRYIVDEPGRKKKARPVSPKLDIEKIVKAALEEVMETERTQIVQKVVNIFTEKDDKAARANDKRDQRIDDLIKEQMDKTSAAMKGLEEKLGRAIGEGLKKIGSESEALRGDLKKARDDEKEQLKQHFDKQTKDLISELNVQQQQSNSQSIQSIKEEVSKALKKQEEVQKDMTTVHKKLDEISDKIANQFANIRITNDLDAKIDDETKSNKD